MKGVVFVSQNREDISKFAAIVPLPEQRFLKIAQDKWSFYCFAKEQKLPVVLSILVGDSEGKVRESADLDGIEYPALLKPTHESGGRGIIKVSNPNDFHRVWKNKGTLKRGQRYILQSYIPGEDLCLGVFCKEGRILAYTLQKDLSPTENYFGGQRIMEFVHDERVIDLGRRLVSAMNWNGTAFIDFRIDAHDETVRLVEVNPRLGQAILGSLLAGVNFPLMLCLDAMGVPYPNMEQNNGIRYAHPLASWKLLLSGLRGRKTADGFKWRESALQFSVSDPLPELIEVVRRITKIKGSRSLHR